ncbi:MAG: hypothetical protein EAZ12_05210 [Sphingobacteriia bacterium]|nr:MAG: hypothetical protein EAZ12_05210 [Sphingobacteriia bacterium]
MEFSTLFWKKIRLIFPILLLLIVGINFFEITLRRAIAKYAQSLDFEEETWNLLIPILLSGIALFIFLLPKLKLLVFPSNEKTTKYTFLILSWVWFVFLISFTQNFYTNYSNKLIDLNRIEDIQSAPVSRYYHLNNGNLARIHTCSFTNYSVSNKGGRLNINIYFSIPIFSPGNYYPQLGHPYWYGVKFHKEFSNRVSAEIKNKMINQFYDECKEELNTFDAKRMSYLVRKTLSKDTRFFFKAIENRMTIFNPQSTIILQNPAYEEIADITDNDLKGFLITLFIGSLIFLLLFSNKKISLKESTFEIEHTK